MGTMLIEILRLYAKGLILGVHYGKWGLKMVQIIACLFDFHGTMAVL